jgi:hypothetical protein
MLHLLRSIFTAAALCCSTVSAISLGGKAFSVAADKRQAQDLVRLQLLMQYYKRLTASTGDMGRALTLCTRRTNLPVLG